MEAEIESNRNRLCELNLTQVEGYWRELLKGLTTCTSLLGDRTSFKSDQNDRAYQEQTIQLTDSLTSKLVGLTKEHDLTIQTLLCGAWSLLLSRYSSETDVLFGLQAAFKAEKAAIPSRQVPIRVRVSSEASLFTWLKELQTQWEILQADSHPSLSQIQEWSDIPVGTPLFESLLCFSDDSTAIAPANDVSCPIVMTGQIESDIQLRMEYSPNRFDADTIARLLTQVQTLLEGMVTHPEQCLATLSLLTPAERHQVLIEWNHTQIEYPNQCIHQLFQAQVAKSPDSVALVMATIGQDAPQQLTYQQLDDRANQLAYCLKRSGVEPGAFVAMCFDRSIETIVAMLGILKTGGVYVPLDPAYPQERLAWMLADSGASILLTQSHLVDRLPGHQSKVVCLDADWGATPQFQPVSLDGDVNASSLAYVNYTSGSTGRPKGVTIPHRGVVRLVFGNHYTPLDAHQTLLHLAPISFDAATFEIWGALLHGGRCVLFPGNGIPDPQALGSVIQNYGVTTLWLTAALFNTIIAETSEALTGAREILTGGEALSIAHIRQALEQLPDTQLINGYGPTESTTFTCCYRIPRDLDPNLISIPIGKPIANTEVYVLDADQQPVRIGVIGELYIGGDGLAQGYLNCPDLTQEKFIAHPFRSEATARLYKTGDQVRYLPDGNLEFIGRKDHQVKIRGHRIELGEIEAVLVQHDSIRDAIVLVREDTPGNQRLIAYITPQPTHILSVSHLKAYLGQRLSEYMVPNTLMVLDNLPLTPNGKVDRRALPTPVKGRSGTETFVAPHTPTEQILAELWCGVLGLDQVGIEDNFFDLGGTSLLGLQLIARVQKQLSEDFRAVQLYQYPTIRALAQHLNPEVSKTPASDPQARAQRQKTAQSRWQRPAKRG